MLARKEYVVWLRSELTIRKIGSMSYVNDEMPNMEIPTGSGAAWRRGYVHGTDETLL